MTLALFLASIERAWYLDDLTAVCQPSFAVRVYSRTCNGFVAAFEAWFFLSFLLLSCLHIRDYEDFMGDDWDVARASCICGW